ncbi:MAG: uridine diphosphate-N-acetylglucosamine-binding protein YvcK, partial [Candidatus Omnitrophica bacterium]|nr:uridine diphosphate-N-acetylglucosamine-binding protein YvcK [Candidatus Omnitrophota bacterium]
MANKKLPSIVCVGGGTGQAQLLRGLRAYPCELTAIVTVTDTGRSSGMLRKEMHVLPPGDIRNCLIALSDSEKLLQDLFQYRFEKGSLEGHSFGNLFIAALSKVAGSFEESIKETSKILAIKGKVLPSTLDNADICAILSDGSVREGEVAVRGLNKSAIKTVFLKPAEARASKEALEAIYNADLIVLGPGSLYTSVITNLLIKGLRAAVKKSGAKKVYICNIMTQPGQSDGYSTEDHINAIIKYLGQKTLDYVIINEEAPPKKALEEYKKDNAFLLKPLFPKAANRYSFNIISDNLIEKDVKKQRLWHKQHLLRHDSDKIAKILIGLTNPQLKAVILAAGEGSRLKPFSLSESKTMIRFLGKPLLAHHVDEFIKNGIEDIVIVCNEQNSEHVKNYFTKNYAQDFKYVIQREQKGPVHAIMCAEAFLRGGHFIYKYGDSLALKDELKELLSIFSGDRTTNGIVTLKKVEDPSEFSSARFEKGALVELIEKPKQHFPSKLSHVGLGLLNAERFFDACKKTGFDVLIPPPEYLLRQRYKLRHWISESARIDMGRVWNILEATKLLSQKLGARVESTHVSPHAYADRRAYIGPNAIINDGVSIVGYSSVDAFIDKNTVIIDSVIMEGSRIGKNCRIENSVIGKHNLIEDNFRVIPGEDQAQVYVKDKYVKPAMPKLGCFTGDNVTIMENLTARSGKMIFPNKLVTKDIDRDMLIRAILFDADNTLYNTRKIAQNADMKAIRHLASKSGLSIRRLYSEWKTLVRRLAKSRNPKERHRKYSYSQIAKKHDIYNKEIVEAAFNSFLN